MRAAALLLAAAATAPSLVAQASADPERAATDALAQGRHLQAMDQLAAATDGSGKPRDTATFQTWTQVLPFVANGIDPAVFVRAYGAPPPPDPTLSARIAAARPRNALAQIVGRARTTSIVVLNEDHTSPRDRAFASAVVRPSGWPRA